MADQAALARPEREADLRQLRRLARAGLAADDHDGVGARSPRRSRRPAARPAARADTRSRDDAPRARSAAPTERATAASIRAHSAPPADRGAPRSIRRASAGASAAIVSGSCAIRRAAGEVAAMRRATDSTSAARRGYDRGHSKGGGEKAPPIRRHFAEEAMTRSIRTDGARRLPRRPRSPWPRPWPTRRRCAGPAAATCRRPTRTRRTRTSPTTSTSSSTSSCSSATRTCT